MSCSSNARTSVLWLRKSSKSQKASTLKQANRLRSTKEHWTKLTTHLRCKISRTNKQSNNAAIKSQQVCQSPKLTTRWKSVAKAWKRVSENCSKAWIVVKVPSSVNSMRKSWCKSWLSTNSKPSYSTNNLALLLISRYYRHKINVRN